MSTRDDPLKTALYAAIQTFVIVLGKELMAGAIPEGIPSTTQKLEYELDELLKPGLIDQILEALGFD